MYQVNYMSQWTATYICSFVCEAYVYVYCCVQIAHYPTKDLLGMLGLLKQRVTMFNMTQMTLPQKKIPAQW